MSQAIKWVKVAEDDDIYIDCSPVNEIGEVVESSGDLISPGLNLPTFSSELLNNNIGFQSMLGIVLLGVIYGVGDYVFNIFPNKIINNNRFES